MNLYGFVQNTPVSSVDPRGHSGTNTDPFYQQLKGLEGLPCCKEECTIELKAVHQSIQHISVPEKFIGIGEAVLDTRTGDCNYALTHQSWWTCCKGGVYNSGEGPLNQPGLQFECPCTQAMATGDACNIQVRYYYISCVNRKWKLKKFQLTAGYDFDYESDATVATAKAWFIFGNTIQVYPTIRPYP